MKVTLEGRVDEWTLFGCTRRSGTLSVPYEMAREILKAFRFDGLTGKGEQRDIRPDHARKIEKEMRDGRYTPTTISAGMRKSHQTDLKISPQKTFLLTIDSKSPLPMTDGGHRMHGLGSILADLEARHKQELNPERKTILAEQIAEVLRLPISITIHFDGDPQDDFINLQAGRAVDPSHLLSLKIRRQAASEPMLAMAFDIARRLATTEDSPYLNQVRFDSRGLMSLPLSTLCARGSSDLSTSLVGLAKVGAGQNADWLAARVIEVFLALKRDCPEVLEYSKVLTPISNSGTKGSATMLVGVTILAVYDALSRPEGQEKSLDIPRLVEAVRQTLDVQISGSFSGGQKRDLMYACGEKFFAGRDDLHEDIPLGLVQTLSASCYGIAPLPKPPKATKAAKPKPEGATDETKKATTKKVTAKKPAAKKTSKKATKKKASRDKTTVALVEEPLEPTEPVSLPNQASGDPWDKHLQESV